MPNRILRESALDSDRIAAVDEPSEVLFYRLLLLADDFGRFDGRVPVIRGRAFALRNDVSEDEIKRRLEVLTSVGLIDRYEVDGKPYIEIPRFGQRQRAEKSKYPEKTSDTCQSSGGQEPASRTPRARGRSSESKAESYSKESSSLRSDDTRTPPKATPRSELESVLKAEHAEAVIEHRQRMRKPLTARAAKLLAGKFAGCPDPNEAADAMIANGWQGFEVAWLKNRAAARAPPGPGPAQGTGYVAAAKRVIERHERLENGAIRDGGEGADEAEGGDPPALPGR